MGDGTQKSEVCTGLTFFRTCFQALREIQNSPYAKKVFEQIKTQEATKQQELKVKEAEYKAAAEKAAIVRSLLLVPTRAKRKKGC